jgi:hypothetical protein
MTADTPPAAHAHDRFAGLVALLAVRAGPMTPAPAESAARRFDALLGAGRNSHRRPASNRGPQVGDLVSECPNPDCDGRLYKRMGEDPVTACDCGTWCNANYARYLGRVRADGTLDARGADRAASQGDPQSAIAAAEPARRRALGLV